jgi:hypothetical protein
MCLMTASEFVELDQAGIAVDDARSCQGAGAHSSGYYEVQWMRQRACPETGIAAGESGDTRITGESGKACLVGAPRRELRDPEAS